MDCSMPGFPVLHSLPEFTQTHVHWVSDAIQPSHLLLPPSPPVPNLSQHQYLFQRICSLHQVAKVLEFQLQHQSQVFQVVMYGCDSWTIKKAEHWRTDAFELWCLEKTLESPLDCKEMQPVHPKGDQSWVFIGRTDVEAETQLLWPPDLKSWLIWKDHDAGKDWGQKEKGMTEVEMVWWHHQLNGHEFE